MIFIFFKYHQKSSIIVSIKTGKFKECSVKIFREGGCDITKIRNYSIITKVLNTIINLCNLNPFEPDKIKITQINCHVNIDCKISINQFVTDWVLKSISKDNRYVVILKYCIDGKMSTVTILTSKGRLVLTGHCLSQIISMYIHIQSYLIIPCILDNLRNDTKSLFHILPAEIIKYIIYLIQKY